MGEERLLSLVAEHIDGIARQSLWKTTDHGMTRDAADKGADHTYSPADGRIATISGGGLQPPSPANT